MTKREIARAVRLYDRGNTLREIAADFGVDRKTIWRAIRGQVEARGPGPRGRTDVTDQLVVELRDDDQLSWSAVADAVGMSKTGVQIRHRAAHGFTRDRVSGQWVRRADQ